MALAVVEVFNNTGSRATIEISHQFRSQPVESTKQEIGTGVTGNPFTIKFEPEPDTGRDRWFVSVRIIEGDKAGLYQSRNGSRKNPGTYFKVPAGETVAHFSVGIESCTLHFPSSNTTVTLRLRKVGVFPEAGAGIVKQNFITNVFVLMLENRSFDHLFGWCDPHGFDVEGNRITAETIPDNSPNVFANIIYPPTSVPLANLKLDIDPGHNFLDVMEQLCGEAFVARKIFSKEDWYAQNPLQQPDSAGYPQIHRDGFAANYARQYAETWRKPLVSKAYTPSAELQQSMIGVAREENLVLRQLAREFAVCDHWFSSMPGPTWPNRFFSLAGSSAGLDDSPPVRDVGESILIPGATYKFENDTLFGRLKKLGGSWRIYMDKDNRFVQNSQSHYLGKFAISRALPGVNVLDIDEFGNLASNLQDTYNHQFTLIEPNYGDLRGHTYQSGSSQHPIDTLDAGEKLIAATYKAIRNSPIWETSVLIITYDEHGGLYDHVVPPHFSAPGDSALYNQRGFDFQQLGVRVPAVVISPLIPKHNSADADKFKFNVVDQTVRDHTSIISTVTEQWRLGNLTNRDKEMPSVLSLLTLDTVRANCPTDLDLSHLEKNVPPADDNSDRKKRDAQPLPDSGNLIGSLQIAIDTDFELSDQSQAAWDAIVARVALINTYGDANAYALEVMAKVEVEEDVQAIFGGEMSAADIGKLAQTMGMTSNDLQSLIAACFATALDHEIQIEQLTTTQVELILSLIDELEADKAWLSDQDGDFFVIPVGSASNLNQLRNPS